MRRWVLILALGAAACSSRTQSAAQISTGAEHAAPVSVTRPPPPPVDSPRVNVASSNDADYLGTINREGLVAIIDQGLGRFLQRVRLEPKLLSGKFQGFRVASLDPAWQGVGIEAGDVIVRLNGLAIERPEQALTAFESLRTASEVKVEVNRAGQLEQVRYRIE